MRFLSIQSHVAYGHVGNSSAVFAAQRLGVEVWPVHTVQFSNHTGYGAWTGRVFDGQAVEEVVGGIADRGASAQNASLTSPGGRVRPIAAGTSGTSRSCPEASARMIGASGGSAASRRAA